MEVVICFASDCGGDRLCPGIVGLELVKGHDGNAVSCDEARWDKGREGKDDLKLRGRTSFGLIGFLWSWSIAAGLHRRGSRTTVGNGSIQWKLADTMLSLGYLGRLWNRASDVSWSLSCDAALGGSPKLPPEARISEA